MRVKRATSKKIRKLLKKYVSEIEEMRIQLLNTSEIVAGGS